MAVDRLERLIPRHPGRRVEMILLPDAETKLAAPRVHPARAALRRRRTLMGTQYPARHHAQVPCNVRLIGFTRLEAARAKRRSRRRGPRVPITSWQGPARPPQPVMLRTRKPTLCRRIRSQALA